MSRALALDGEIPGVTLLDGSGVGIGDVIVAEISGSNASVTQSEIEHIRNTLERVWPNNKIVVCPPHIRLKVAKQA